jgi:predicted small secreted protein
MKKIALLTFAFLVFGSLSLAAAKTVTGVVSDSKCGLKHATAGPGDCIEHCVAGGATYVVVSKGKIYQVDAQDKFKGLGGKSVTVTGAVKGDSITVTSVAEKSM